MANTKIGPSTYFLFIDPAGGTNYDLLVCLESFSFDGTTASNDASTMCGEDISPGSITSNIAFTGQTIIDPTSSQESAWDVFTLWHAKTKVGWKIARAIPVAGDATKTGAGFITAYHEDYNQTDNAKFNGTIGVSGTSIQTVEGS